MSTTFGERKGEKPNKRSFSALSDKWMMIFMSSSSCNCGGSKNNLPYVVL